MRSTSTKERARKSSSCRDESHLELLEKAEPEEARARSRLQSPALSWLGLRIATERKRARLLLGPRELSSTLSEEMCRRRMRR